MRSILFRQPVDSAPNASEATSLAFIGALVSGLLILSGLVFRTYMISMSSSGMEVVRQLGLPFMFAELAMIGWAVSRGFVLELFWAQTPRAIKWLSVLFLATFWIGSVFYSEVRFLAVLHNIFLLIHIVFAYALVWTVGAFRYDDLMRMAKALVIGLALFCLMTGYALIFHPPFDTMPNNEIIWQFAIPGFISLRLFGAFCGAIFCFLLGVLFLADEKKTLNRWPILWIALSAGMMIWSATRAAVVGSIAALFMVMVFHRVRPGWRTWLWIIAALVCATAVASALVPYDDPNFQFFNVEDGQSADAASGGRLSYWAAVWQAYLQVPYFGAGPFATQLLTENGQPTHVQPHNILLQFLITWGLFATIFALALLAWATLKAHLVALRYRIVLPFLMMLDCLLVMSLFDGMTHFAQQLMLIMIGFGAIFGYERGVMQNPKTLAI